MAYAPALLTLPADKPRVSRLICFVFGVLTTLAFAPFQFSPGTVLFVLPLLFVCLTVSPRDAGGHAFWYGFGLFLSGTYWIYISVVVFGEAPIWIALILMLGLTLSMSLWLFAAGWLISRLTHGEPILLLFVVPAAWVLIEWLRGWVLTGFPWLAFGYAHVDSPLGGLGPVLGIYGISFAVMVSASAILSTILCRGRQRIVALVMVFLPGLLGGSLQFIDWTEADGDPVRVTILQAGVSQDQKWLPENRQPTLDYYRDATRIATDSDIVVWPEVAIPSLSSYEQGFIAQLQSDAHENDQTILFGILEDEQVRGERLIYNSVILVDGGARQSYRKRHLVPFGEYFPVPDRVRGLLRMLSLPHSDITKGDDQQPLLGSIGGPRLAVQICYEDAYGAEQLYALPEAGILINVSNDAWFGDSIAPHQHLQIARMRSLEFGRPSVRSTNTGISAFIGHRGDLVQTGPQFEEVSMTADVQARRGATPYVSMGNLPILAICLSILGIGWIRARR